MSGRIGARPLRSGTEGNRLGGTSGVRPVRPARLGPAEGGRGDRERRRHDPGTGQPAARLAVVGVTWYTRLERARDIQVSGEVADSIAGALSLDSTERTRLFALAGVADPHAHPQRPALSPVIETMPRQFEPRPAAVTSSRLDVPAYNRTYGSPVVGLDRVPLEDRDFPVHGFLHPAWRKGVVDQETVTKVAAKYRAAMVEHRTDPPLRPRRQVRPSHPVQRHSGPAEASSSGSRATWGRCARAAGPTAVRR